LATASAATDIPAAEAVLFARGRDAAQALIDLIDGLRSNGNETGPLLDALITETTNCWLKESLGGLIGMVIHREYSPQTSKPK
jgi:hypothetical protein